MRQWAVRKFQPPSHGVLTLPVWINLTYIAKSTWHTNSYCNYDYYLESYHPFQHKEIFPCIPKLPYFNTRGLRAGQCWSPGVSHQVSVPRSDWSALLGPASHWSSRRDVTARTCSADRGGVHLQLPAGVTRAPAMKEGGRWK